MRQRHEKESERDRYVTIEFDLLAPAKQRTTTNEKMVLRF
jgi:hypothetical protein